MILGWGEEGRNVGEIWNFGDFGRNNVQRSTFLGNALYTKLKRSSRLILNFLKIICCVQKPKYTTDLISIKIHYLIRALDARSSLRHQAFSVTNVFWFRGPQKFIFITISIFRFTTLFLYRVYIMYGIYFSFINHNRQKISSKGRGGRRAT